jgi:hypothetical protein
VSTAQFALTSTNPDNVIVSFTANSAGGWINTGSANNLFLSASGCPLGPMLAGAILIDVKEPGSLCIGPVCGWKAVTSCGPNPSFFPVEWIGLNFGGGPCQKGSLCGAPVSVETQSWGKIKAMYR